MAKSADVVIIGAGLAGLRCAELLAQAGVEFLLLEASDGPGGRVRTDESEGFLLDRGFQVLLESYPEARAALDYKALDLKPFYPGAMVRAGGRFDKVADPFRRPLDAAASAFSGVGSLADKMRVAKLRSQAREGSLDDLFARPEASALRKLQSMGFGDAMIDRFFRPFLGGVLLDPSLGASSRMMEFVIRMFSEGDVSVPAEGMGAIPKQMAGRLLEETLRLNERVAGLDGLSISLESGGTVEAAKAVVVAVEGPEASRLLGGKVENPGSNSVSCLYFAADEPPVAEPILVLNGEGSGPINNLCVPSEVAPTYAPEGKSLVSISVLEEFESPEAMEEAVRAHARDWFGDSVDAWRHLRTYGIAHAQPKQEPGTLEPPRRPVRLDDGLFVCGDHRDNASIQGALTSGRRAAEAVLEEVGA